MKYVTNIQYRFYKEGDEKAINDSFNEIFGTNRSIDAWRWKYINSPYGLYTISLAFVNGEIAAQYSGYGIKVDQNINGEVKTYFAYHTGDKMTVPKFRSIGFGKKSLIARVCQNFCKDASEKNITLAYGFVTDVSRAIGKRILGYDMIKNVEYYVAEFNKINLNINFFKSIFRKYNVVKNDTLDSDFDNFYHKALMKHNVLLRKDLKYLQWRYFQHPDIQYEFYSIYDNSQLIGWFVYRKFDDIVLIGDLLSIKYELSFKVFLKYLYDQKKINGSTKIAFWFGNSTKTEKIFNNLGFVKEREPNDLTIVNLQIDKKFDNIKLSNLWHFTKGDSDLF
jgi:hypothetical protein